MFLSSSDKVKSHHWRAAPLKQVDIFHWTVSVPLIMMKSAAHLMKVYTFQYRVSLSAYMILSGSYNSFKSGWKYLKSCAQNWPSVTLLTGLSGPEGLMRPADSCDNISFCCQLINFLWTSAWNIDCNSVFCCSLHLSAKGMKAEKSDSDILKILKLLCKGCHSNVNEVTELLCKIGLSDSDELSDIKSFHFDKNRWNREDFTKGWISLSKVLQASQKSDGSTVQLLR